MSSQELFGDPNTYSQGIWKTRVISTNLQGYNLPNLLLNYSYDSTIFAQQVLWLATFLTIAC